MLGHHYGCTTLSLPKHLEKKLHWKYTRMVSAQVLEAVRYKIAAVCPPAFHITNHISKCWESKHKVRSVVLIWNPAHGHLLKTSLRQLCAYTRCSLEDLQGSMNDWDTGNNCGGTVFGEYVWSPTIYVGLYLKRQNEVKKIFLYSHITHLHAET